VYEFSDARALLSPSHLLQNGVTYVLEGKVDVAA
jgi:hypothetical protein